MKKLLALLLTTTIICFSGCGKSKTIDVSTDFFQKAKTVESESGTIYYPYKLNDKEIYLRKNPKKNLNYYTENADSLEIRRKLGESLDKSPIYSIEEIILNR